MTSKPLPTLIAVVLGTGLVNACGVTGRRAGIASRASNATTAGGTAQSPSRVTATSKSEVDPDHDDHITENYGRAAPAAVRRTITAIVKSYYATATAGDGTKGCSMLSRALAHTVPEDYGRPPGPSYMRGKTCPEVMSKLYGQYHHELTIDHTTIQVTRVRIEGNQALVLLAFGTTPEPRDISLEREGGAWGMTGLLDNSLP